MLNENNRFDGSNYELKPSRKRRQFESEGVVGKLVVLVDRPTLRAKCFRVPQGYSAEGKGGWLG